MKNNKKVVMILAEPCHNDSRVMREAKTLVGAGYRVTILAVWRRGLKRIEGRDGYKIKRLCCFGGDKTIAREIFKNIWFGVSVFLRIIFMRPAVCHIHNIRPLLTSYVAASLVGAKTLYDSHELWEGVAYRRNYPDILFNLLLFIEKVIARRVDVVVTVSSLIARRLREKFHNETMLIRNVSNSQINQNSNLLRIKLGLDVRPEPLIVYQGGFSEPRGCLNLIKAMAGVRAILVFVGSGERIFTARMRATIKNLRLSEKVFIHSAVSANKLHLYTSSANYGVHTIVDTCSNHRYCLPNKFFLISWQACQWR